MLFLTYFTLLFTIISPIFHHTSFVYASPAKNQDEPNNKNDNDNTTEEIPKTVTTEDNKSAEVKDDFDYETKDWGTFYDPKDVFCGQYDCYKILGFDYNELLKENIKDGLLKLITKRYRSLSRKWHPDKNKRKDAKERFVKIKQAYEILSNKDKREEYDYLRDRSDVYLRRYGSSVLYSYAAKSNTWVIIFMLCAAASALTFTAQGQKWKMVADHVVKAAVEDWNVREGGNTQSMEIREKALDILAEQEKQQAEAANNVTNGGTTTAPLKPVKKVKTSKLDLKEKKKQSQEELRKIVISLVDEIEDFGAGFHQPTYKDTLLYKLLFLPVSLFRILAWRMQYALRRLRGLSYDDEELLFFAKQIVGDIAWESATEEEHDEWKGMELWKMSNYEQWREDQDVKKLSVGDQKKHARWKKKNGSKVS